MSESDIVSIEAPRRPGLVGGQRVANAAKNLAFIAFFGIGIALMVGPFYWIIEASLAVDSTDVYSIPPQPLPDELTLDNYSQVFDQVPFERFAWNSFKVASLITIGQLITASMAAYAFARLSFRGRDFLFALVIAALMVPLQVVIVPLFLLMRDLGLTNTHWALILPGLVTPFGIFLLRQHFLTIPKELEDAAFVDGAGRFRTFIEIVLPLSGPALTALGILAFTFWWNDLLFPLVMINDPELQTLPVGLLLLTGRFAEASLSVIAAGITLAILPVLVVFLVLQKQIVRSVASSGLKG